MAAIPFNRNFDAPYDSVERVSPLVRRMLANNPSPFTFKGTGVYIVGSREVAVIDPGPDDAAHLAALKRAVDGLNVRHILITHTHRDHSPAARALKEWTGARIYGFGPHMASSSEAVGQNEGIEQAEGQVEEGGDFDFAPDVRVSDGERIAGDGYTFECLHTPGHTSNHMCYALEQERAVFTGDHVMGWSTSVVIPPDGDMADYMASLKKLLPREDRVYWPTHGGPVESPQAFVDALIAHRVEREEQIVACLSRGIHRIPDMVKAMYADVDPRLHPAAAMSVLAHLIKLVRERRAVAAAKQIFLPNTASLNAFLASARP